MRRTETHNGIVLTCRNHPGARMIAATNMPPVLAYRIKRGAISKTAGDKTAKWRKRHGGAWVSPLNLKFKVKH